MSARNLDRMRKVALALPEATAAGAQGREVALGVRPEAVLVAHAPGPAAAQGRVTNVEPLGSHDIVDVAMGPVTLRA